MGLVPEVAAAGEHHRDAQPIGTASITSASRIEPPGCTIAVTPASPRCFDAVGEREEPVRCEHGPCASGPRGAPYRSRCGPSRRGSSVPRRLRSCVPSFASTIAFDLTCAPPATRNAPRRGAMPRAPGRRRAATTRRRRSRDPLSARARRTRSRADRARGGNGAAASASAGISTSRRFFFEPRSTSAPASNAGAATASRNELASAAAVARSTARFTPTMPPNADSGIRRERRAKRLGRGARGRDAARVRVLDDRDARSTATPCAMRAAASRSSRLLKESSLPPRTRTPPPRAARPP